MSEIRLSFKDMCARFDATPRTLRYYEYIELISPYKDGRTRTYGPREIARMTLILRGRRFGFSLEEIRQFLDIYEKRGSAAQNKEWIALATKAEPASVIRTGSTEFACSAIPTRNAVLVSTWVVF